MAAENILIIDDERVTREQIKDGLRADFEVFEAAGWDEAQSYFKKGIEFALILVDQVLQEQRDDRALDGIEVTEQILRAEPKATVIVYTLRPDEASFERAYAAGARKYIVKNHAEIPALVRQLSSDIPFLSALSDLLESKPTAEVIKILPKYLQGLGCGLSIIDRSFGLWYRNAEHMRMLRGFCAKDRVRLGAPCWVEYLGLYGRDQPCSNCPASVVFQTGGSYRTPVPMRVEKSDGSLVRYFDITSNPIKDDDGRVVGAIQTVVDVTDRENLIAMSARLQTARICDERVVLIMKAINRLGYDRVRHYLLSPAGDTMVLQAAVGDEPGDEPEVKRLPLQGDKYWEHTLQSRRPCLYGDRSINKAAIDLGRDIHTEELHKENVHDWLEFPLIVNDGPVFGTMVIDNKYSQRPLSESDVHKLKDWMDSAANSIQEIREYEASVAELQVSRTLRRVEAEILGRSDVSDALNQVAAACVEHTGALAGFVRLPKGGYLCAKTEQWRSSGGVGEQARITRALPKVRIDNATNRSAMVFATKRRSIVHDAEHDAEFRGLLEWAGRIDENLKNDLSHIKSFAMFPMKYAMGSEESVVGILTVCSDDLDFFSTGLVDLVEVFCQKAAVISLIYEHRSLIEEAAEKKESLARLSEGIAHALRTPLTTVDRGISQLGDDTEKLLNLVDARQIDARDSHLLPDIRSELQDVSKALSRFKKIMEAIYHFSHRGGQPKVPSDLNGTLADSMHMLAGAADLQVTMASELDDSLPLVECDVQRMEQVFVVLLENAVQAAGKGGHVRATTCREGASAVIEIANTGATIPPGLDKKIYEEFFTTKPAGVGSGLGLSVALRIVEEHQGSLSHRREGDETVFVVTLPMRQSRS